MDIVHGGDVYRNEIRFDFSVNINPLGMEKTVKYTLLDAIDQCEQYPDIRSEELRNAISRAMMLPGEWFLPGNGASELFLAAVHAIRPLKTVIPVPSFYGYEYAAGAGDGEILYYPLKKEDGFLWQKDLYAVLTEDVDLLFLANPNNPAGTLLEREKWVQLLHHCKQKGIYVIVDECFIEFCDPAASLIGELKMWENLLLVRAFTKSFAIPGVRLGYLLCNNLELLARIQRQLPEWNVSVPAQKAGVACAKLLGTVSTDSYLERTRECIKTEKEYLKNELTGMGVEVFDSDACFLLFYTQKELMEPLLKKGILIRDASNFRGLSKGYYRIGIKTRAENDTLLRALGELL